MRSHLTAWWNQLNASRTRLGLTAIAATPTRNHPSALSNQVKEIDDQFATMQNDTYFRFANYTRPTNYRSGIDAIRESLDTSIKNTLNSIDTIIRCRNDTSNVFGVNAHGVHSNGALNNGNHGNGAHGNGAHGSNGTNGAHGANSNGACGVNGTMANGHQWTDATNTHGPYFYNGSHSNGNHSNGSWNNGSCHNGSHHNGGFSNGACGANGTHGNVAHQNTTRTNTTSVDVRNINASRTNASGTVVN